MGGPREQLPHPRAVEHGDHDARQARDQRLDLQPGPEVPRDEGPEAAGVEAGVRYQRAYHTAAAAMARRVGR